ncbi:MAG: glycosyltransferase family 4 protein [Verrucomicrobiota bacterium]|nr:glycosyltransferase family 4 protein [Verrucomicrobiota bacterium]
MRIRFYIESPQPGPGGAEQVVALLAEALSRQHDVVLVHHKSDALGESLVQFSGCDLSRVKFQRVDKQPDHSTQAASRWQRYRAAREWQRDLSEDCDLFVAVVHQAPPFSRATNSALIVLFPTFQPGKRDWSWRRRLATYNVKFSISNFTRDWTRERWGVDSELLYPPVDLAHVEVLPKQKRILSVGRFSTSGHTKRQIELIETFRALCVSLSDWSYASVGGLNETLSDRLYFERARRLTHDQPIEVRANLERAPLLALYRTASIFWHAAGFGENVAHAPERAEHFGITTVEAMAHGCVPLVFAAGGQPEIVEDGVNGFVWREWSELKDRTVALARDQALLEKMSAAARARSQIFSREKCVTRFCARVGIATA